MTNFEADWGKAIKKLKQANAVGHVNYNVQKKQIKEELDYFKQKLWEALEQKDEEVTKNTLKKLIKTRSRLLKINLTQVGSDQQEELNNYYFDCFALSRVAGNLLKK
ncbi:hypothetical protein KJ785_01515 [Patescibacteria group bacterium]|nr:hypothetical protein [Patescibacteria group bacterium]